MKKETIAGRNNMVKEILPWGFNVPGTSKTQTNMVQVRLIRH